MRLPEFFGLDIGNHSIKVAQLSRNGESQATLNHIGAVKTEFGLLENASDQGIKQVAEAVKRAKEAAGIRTNNCVAAIPESPVFSRLITIPKVDESKLEESVHWELKPLIPVPLDEVDIAFLEIGEKQQEGDTLIDVYAVAAPKTLTERYKKMAEYAGLELLALETESLANTRAVIFNYETERDIMIFDFGAQGTDLIVSRDGVPVFAQSISTGSDALTRTIAADYGLDINEAEKYKRAFGLHRDEGEGKIAKSIEPIMQIIVNEMSRILTYFRQKIGDTSATKIYMCGEAAKLPGIGEFFQEHIGLGTMMADPVQKIKIANSARKEIDQLSSIGFSVSIGLGLKDS